MEFQKKKRRHNSSQYNVFNSEIKKDSTCQVTLVHNPIFISPASTLYHHLSSLQISFHLHFTHGVGVSHPLPPLLSTIPHNNISNRHQLRADREQPPPPGISSARCQIHGHNPNQALRRRPPRPQGLRQHRRGIRSRHRQRVPIPNSKKALSWVKSNVQCYLPATKISYIAVGNEVLTSNDSSPPWKTSTPPSSPSTSTARSPSPPPSAAVFRRDIAKKLACILDFHCKVGSPFLINAYPYFAYKADPKRVPLDFVLFEGSGIVDSICLGYVCE
ncbi:uncharacterized protein LOC121796124 [Salvia splendens]|uniref:uncharacterized protein LOC121796124 n=1 Tax=Salvia splendens TaxID=180675 RepID=UPI001C2607AE|nr:uncharacterized protein LOC121796124 [Salvia splendens]